MFKYYAINPILYGISIPAVLNVDPFNLVDHADFVDLVDAVDLIDLIDHIEQADYDKIAE